MSEEMGTIIKVASGRAHVQLQRKIDCSDCQGCITEEKDLYSISEAADPFGVSIGDNVKIEIAATNPIIGGFILYILPIILFITGYFVGEEVARVLWSISGSEVPGILTGILFLVLTYIAIYVIQKRVDKKNGAKIVQIL